MDAYLTVLLVVHILGAIAGIGPTFAFGVLGSLSGKMPEQALGLMTAFIDIEKKIVTPVALFTQPASGVLLIFKTNRDDHFFQREWLVIAIVLYLTILYLAYMRSNPRMHKMLEMIKTGTAGTPEFGVMVKAEQRLGPILAIMTVAIAVLMVWKPLDGF